MLNLVYTIPEVVCVQALLAGFSLPKLYPQTRKESRKATKHYGEQALCFRFGAFFSVYL